ncbi:cysteine desulfurase [Aequorivita sp. H23M31]|uniref:cysteine desulfurase n=1 Tax=Aequorivita ciconiae TaxID=2494375 RepID=A0A410G013_9FLAO|nr:cysteine desulfurase family protein [Aequorivita sp. H23M31]QAA80604.1 cysteine desulfurase [Aequorivita sp. H23M31]
MKKVYFDNAATTQLRNEVIICISEVLKTEYGNPSSTHSYGRSSKSLLENARKEIAGLLNVSASEIIFTSGGTEADNLILISAVRDLGVKRVISSRVEHHAVLHTLEWLNKNYDIVIDYVNLDKSGLVDYNDLDRLLSDASEKTLVSLMHVNNEVGNLLDIKKVALLCKEHGALFHSDTVQSIGHFKMDLKDIPIDFAAASAHKFHGPKGVGFAFVRKNSGLQPLIHGGEQERGMRAGTEPVSNIAGMAEALKISYRNLDKEHEYIADLKSYFIDKLKSSIPGVKFNGSCEDQENSTCKVLNICLPIAADKAMMLLFQLDLKGIACSKGSACQSGSEGGSHVLNEILSEEDLKKPSLRFSLSVFNNKDEIDFVIEILKEFVN